VLQSADEIMPSLACGRRWKNLDFRAAALSRRRRPIVALGTCRTHEINSQILKQMESTSAFSATKFFLAGNLDSFVSVFG
jgi:hypothetical protein